MIAKHKIRIRTESQNQASKMSPIVCILLALLAMTTTATKCKAGLKRILPDDASAADEELYEKLRKEYVLWKHNSPTHTADYFSADCSPNDCHIWTVRRLVVGKPTDFFAYAGCHYREQLVGEDECEFLGNKSTTYKYFGEYEKSDNVHIINCVCSTDKCNDYETIKGKLPTALPVATTTTTMAPTAAMTTDTTAKHSCDLSTASGDCMLMTILFIVACVVALPNQVDKY